jgi:hypothetical protein
MEEIGGLAGVVREREFVQRKKKTLTGGPGVSARWREKSVPLWGFTRLGHGPNRGLGGSFSPAFFTNFFCSVIFLFMFSGLFHILFKFDSNQFKPLPKFF